MPQDMCKYVAVSFRVHCSIVR